MSTKLLSRGSSSASLLSRGSSSASSFLLRNSWERLAIAHPPLLSFLMSTKRQSSTLKSSPDLCDEFEDTIRVVDPALGLQNLSARTHFGGSVVTVKCFEDNSLVKQLAKTPGRGKVVVVDGGGSRRRALLGDMVAADFVANGWEGLVIYGSIRDVDEIFVLQTLGVQALGTHPCKTKKRKEGQMNVPVTFGGVTFSSGDYIVCDNNGIVVNDTPMDG